MGDIRIVKYAHLKVRSPKSKVMVHLNYSGRYYATTTGIAVCMRAGYIELQALNHRGDLAKCAMDVDPTAIPELCEILMNMYEQIRSEQEKAKEEVNANGSKVGDSGKAG